MTCLAQHTVHEQIGIPPDRRGEVRVVLGRESEMPKARRVVPRLLHRPQHQRCNGSLFGCAADAIDQLLKLLRCDSTSSRAQAVAEGRDELLEVCLLYTSDA